ncbi:MAG: hypothetical protein GF418_14510 [Chitinivibrionales bacterium]|nr:hypothetical protein [Chitinivibrionales bacterium]MBD3396833.1 hypothetical protein [Chitinivibrionales bacterium]
MRISQRRYRAYQRGRLACRNASCRGISQATRPPAHIGLRTARSGRTDSGVEPAPANQRYLDSLSVRGIRRGQRRDSRAGGRGMKRQAYLQAAAALCTEGIYTTKRERIPWEQGQSGPLDVKRSQVWEQPFTGFGKLQVADRLAFSAAALVFSQLDRKDHSRIGISMGSAFGSLSTDIRYMESVASGFPRPAYFSATLPSSAVAEVAIRFKLKGPNRVVVGGRAPGFWALDCALSALASKKATGMLVLSVNGTDREDLESALVPPDKSTEPHSWAWLLTADRIDSGLNMRLAVDGDFASDVPAGTEESYFVEMIAAAAQRQDFSRNLNAQGFAGSISLQKDS